MTIVDSVLQDTGERVLETAKMMGWNDDIGRTESALDYLVRKTYEQGVQDGAVSGIQDLGKYKRTVTLQRRVNQLQSQRIAVLELQLATIQGGAAAEQFILKHSPLNSDAKLNYPIKVEPPCRAQQVDGQMVCKCGNLWNPYGEFWPACRDKQHGA